MSLILDALKKLEKDRITRRKRSVHIASDILLAGEPAARRKALILIAGLTGIAVAALMLTLVIVNPFSTRTPIQEQETVLPGSAQPAKSVPASEPIAEKKKTRTETEDRIAAAAKVSKQKGAAAPGSRAKPVVFDETQLPILTVSGIVWVEDRGVRKAMVNGEVVGEGGKVGRTRVVEIHPDHVIFSHDGRNFSVHMK
jgi:general secretion pathway protein B